MHVPDGQTVVSARGARPVGSDQEGLPPWLYESPEEAEPAGGQVTTTSVEVRASEASSYLADIHDALPSTEGWLSSSQSRGLARISPAQAETGSMSDTRSGARRGCLPLVLVIVCSLISLGLSWVV